MSEAMDRAVELWAEGVSGFEIAARLGVGHGTFYRWKAAEPERFPERRDLVTPEKIDVAATLWAAGRKADEIAAHFGIHEGTVRKWALLHRDRFPKRAPGKPRVDLGKRREASALWHQGKRPEDIAAVIGVKLTTIWKWASADRVLFPRRERVYSPDSHAVQRARHEAKRKAIGEKLLAGASVAVAAEALGASTALVRDVKRGLETAGHVFINRDKMPWSAAEKAKALELRASMAPREIGLMLGKSRNAVIGFFHREDRAANGGKTKLELGIDGRLRADAKPRAAKALVKRTVCETRGRPKTIAAKSKNSGMLRGDNFRLSGTDGIVGKSLFDLGPFDCRWPVNAPDRGVSPSGHPVMREGDAEHLFCGEAVPSEGGRRPAYCALHRPFSITTRQQQIDDAAAYNHTQRRGFHFRKMAEERAAG